MKSLCIYLLFLAGAIDAANTNDGLRWTSTATNGSGLELGSPLTLTWSIVPDNLALSTFAAHPNNPNPTSDLIARLDNMWSVPNGDRISDLTQRPWFPAIASQFDLYASKIGLSYQYVIDDGAPIGFPGKTVSPTRGDIRLAGTALSGALGYNNLPNNGDMVLNTLGNTFANANTLSFIVGHEHGHGLGLNHVLVNGNPSNSVVSASGGNINGPQLDDLLALHRKYGDVFEKNGGNDTPATATSLGSVSLANVARAGFDIDDVKVAALQTDILSIDDNSDTDVFSFDLATPQEVVITVTPRGEVYTYVPEGGVQATLNTPSRSNLSFLVRNSSGSIIANANSQTAGTAETLTLDLPTSGLYTIAVTGGANSTQFYSIEIRPLFLDSDNDGIPDTDEPAGDLDGDGSDNFLDPDADGDGVEDGREVSSGRDPWVPEFFFLFNEEGNAEGWTADSDLGPLTLANGVVLATTPGSDPKLRSPNLRLDSANHPFIAVRLRSNLAGTCQLFWTRLGTLGEAVSPSLGIPVAGDNNFVTLLFDLTAHPDWVGKTITRLRIDPTNKSNATIEIDRIWSTDGDADDDGWPDADETPGDADNDGLENWMDADSDNDGLKDGVELAKDRDPLDGIIFFHFDGDAEGWMATADIGTPLIANSRYQFTTTGIDPKLTRAIPPISGDDVQGFLILMKADQSSRMDLFWGIPGAQGASPDRRVTTDYQASPNQQWLYLDTFQHPTWSGNTITNLRLDPTALSGVNMEIDLILTSDGDYDNDGIPDAIEGTGDPDEDGIPNMADSDSDGDAIPDSIENNFGRDPYASGEDLVDADGDGVSDFDEMIFDTNPDQADSRPTIMIDPGPALGITARAGRTYQLERANNGLSSWVPVGPPISIIADQQLNLTDPSPPTDKAFYRYRAFFTPSISPF